MFVSEHFYVPSLYKFGHVVNTRVNCDFIHSINFEFYFFKIIYSLPAPLFLSLFLCFHFNYFISKRRTLLSIHEAKSIVMKEGIANYIKHYRSFYKDKGRLYSNQN
jgi:hypothetical protein